jgi:hypothetical protein
MNMTREMFYWGVARPVVVQLKQVTVDTRFAFLRKLKLITLRQHTLQSPSKTIWWIYEVHRSICKMMFRHRQGKMSCIS